MQILISRPLRGTRLGDSRAQVINHQVLKSPSPKSSNPQVLKSSNPLMTTGHDRLIEIFDERSSCWRPDVVAGFSYYTGSVPPAGSLIFESQTT